MSNKSDDEIKAILLRIRESKIADKTDGQLSYRETRYGVPTWNKGICTKESTKQQISKTTKGRKRNEESTAKMVDTMRDRWKSEEFKKACRESALKQSDETRKRKSLGRMGIVYEKKECPYCGQLSDPGNYNRWHGDKCKHKPID